jgi:hypothetical protein
LFQSFSKRITVKFPLNDSWRINRKNRKDATYMGDEKCVQSLGQKT